MALMLWLTMETVREIELEIEETDEGHTLGGLAVHIIAHYCTMCAALH
jgi:hypothetical protein